MYVYAYMRIYVHTYIRIYVYAYIRNYVYTYMSSSQDQCAATKVWRPKILKKNSMSKNVGNHLKRVFPKSQPKRSHPQGVNGRSKFHQKLTFFDVFDVEK